MNNLYPTNITYLYRNPPINENDNREYEMVIKECANFNYKSNSPYKIIADRDDKYDYKGHCMEKRIRYDYVDNGDIKKYETIYKDGELYKKEYNKDVFYLEEIDINNKNNCTIC